MTAPSSATAASHARACLAKAAPIPGWPLLTMAGAAAGSQSDFDSLQKAVDYLTCKAQSKLAFTDEEKAFLKRIFESLWWGGEFKGYPEAAVLANHYVNGKGAKLIIDARVYQTSVVVKDTTEAMKDYIRQLIAHTKSYSLVRSSDPGFLHSPSGQRMSRSAGRNLQRQGYILPDGNLLTEQANERLKNANNRFVLGSQNKKDSSGGIVTLWNVDDRYTFEPFERASFYTNIPLSSSHVLKIPDGLSNYMTILKIADEFIYSAVWTETWHA